MEQPVLITQLDGAAMAWIAQEAERTGQPIEAIARQLIYRGLEVENQQAGRHERYHDLDTLAGTWSAEEAEEFRQAIADLDQVDPSLWQ